MRMRRIDLFQEFVPDPRVRKGAGVEPAKDLVAMARDKVVEAVAKAAWQKLPEYSNGFPAGAQFAQNISDRVRAGEEVLVRLPGGCDNVEAVQLSRRGAVALENFFGASTLQGKETEDIPAVMAESELNQAVA